jgi:hypothetical protein
MRKEKGIGKQGRSRSASDNARAIQHIAVQQQCGLSFDKAVKAVAIVELSTAATLRNAVLQFCNTGTLSEPPTAHRGLGNPNHPLHPNNTDQFGPSLDAELLMHELVHSQKTEGVSMTSTTIAAEVRTRLGVSVHRSTVRRWLRALGYRYRHKRYVGGMKPQAKRIRIRG